MKKIFSFCVVLLSALAMNAQSTITCADAKTMALALGEGATATDTVRVLGYITNTNGNVSTKNPIPQQTFYMDDQKGTALTLQAYWANIPEEDRANLTPLNVGDKVILTGCLMHYVDSKGNHIAEIKNGDVEVVERAVVNIDTIPMTTCEVIEEAEALAAGEYLEDVIEVSGVVDRITNTSATQQTFFMVCDENSKSFQAYNVNITTPVAVGDSVIVRGKVMNYNGTQIEANGGFAWTTKKSELVIDTIDVTVAQALAVAQALENNATTKDYYRITGYVDSISSAYSAQYKNISFFLCDDLAAPAYEFQCYRVAGGEDIELGAMVVVTGTITHYYKAATADKPEVHGYQTPQGATYENLSTAIETIGAEVETIKIIRNGEVIILRGGEEFTILGQQK